MGQQIRFFGIPPSDYSNQNVSFTVSDPLADSDGQDIVNFLRNRNLTSSWLTTGSLDANETELLVDFIDSHALTSLFLVKHNLKSFKLEFFDGAALREFDNVTDNTKETTEHVFPDGANVVYIKLTIFGTMIPDADKRITQFLASIQIGQLEGWPEISGMTHTTGMKVSTMLSGKSAISNSVGGTSFDLKVKVEESQADVDLFESLYYMHKRGVMVYVGGGNDSQFRIRVKGYRLEDFYIMKPVKDYRADLYKSLYESGPKIDIKLREVI